MPASRKGKTTSAPSVIIADVAALALATSLKSPTMLLRTLMFGLTLLAPAANAAAAWVVGGISAPPT